MSHDEIKRTVMVLSAPTGGGKTTIARRVVKADHAVRFSVSHTTRQARPGEQDGRDYHFVEHEAFEKMASEGEFLEWAEVHGHLYGTHASEATRAFSTGMDLLLDIDVQGGLQIRNRVPEAVMVFLLPPSLDTLLERIKERVKEADFNLEKRLRTAERELVLAASYDYNIVNEDLDTAVERVLWILRIARLRPLKAAGVRVSLSREIASWLRSLDVRG